MNYIIDPKVFSAVFTVPAAVADKHLKLARGEHIKVLLYIMRNMSVNPDNAEIAAAAGLSAHRGRRYFFFTSLFFRMASPSFSPNASPRRKPVKVIPAAAANFFKAAFSSGVTRILMDSVRSFGFTFMSIAPYKPIAHIRDVNTS